MRNWLVRHLDRLINYLEQVADRHEPHVMRAATRPEAVMSMRVIRADGSIEDKGVVSRSVLTRLAAKRLTKRGDF